MAHAQKDVKGKLVVDFFKGADYPIGITFNYKRGKSIMAQGRKRLTEADYHRVAGEKLLEFIGPKPYNKSEQTKWRCKVTGLILNKSYDAVRGGEFGSRYQRHLRRSWLMYNKLADRLGIRFKYDPETDYFPANTKSTSIWVNRKGEEVKASYHTLGYGFISQKLCDELGLDYRKVNNREAMA